MDFFFLLLLLLEPVIRRRLREPGREMKYTSEHGAVGHPYCLCFT
jgi:hypothetical protein